MDRIRQMMIALRGLVDMTKNSTNQTENKLAVICHLESILKTKVVI